MLQELPDGKWFCSSDCGKIDASLQNLLVRGVENLPESLVDTIRKKNMQIGSDSETGLDVSWRLLSGKIASPETRPLLSQAVAIFHVGFLNAFSRISSLVSIFLLYVRLYVSCSYLGNTLLLTLEIFCSQLFYYIYHFRLAEVANYHCLVNLSYSGLSLLDASLGCRIRRKN